jgi:hypothetical protein
LHPHLGMRREIGVYDIRALGRQTTIDFGV